MIQLKIEMYGMTNNNSLYLSNTANTDYFNPDNLDIVLRTILHGFYCMGFQWNFDIESEVLKNLKNLRSGVDRFKLLAEFSTNIQLPNSLVIRVYGKRR